MLLPIAQSPITCLSFRLLSIYFPCIALHSVAVECMVTFLLSVYFPSVWRCKVWQCGTAHFFSYFPFTLNLLALVSIYFPQIPQFPQIPHIPRVPRVSYGTRVPVCQSAVLISIVMCEIRTTCSTIETAALHLNNLLIHHSSVLSFSGFLCLFDIKSLVSVG